MRSSQFRELGREGFGRVHLQLPHDEELRATVVADNDTAAALPPEYGRVSGFIDVAVDLVRHLES